LAPPAKSLAAPEERLDLDNAMDFDGKTWICHGESPFLIGKSSKNIYFYGPFSMAMLVITRGYIGDLRDL
jgi:hypothetical protein